MATGIRSGAGVYSSVMRTFRSAAQLPPYSDLFAYTKLLIPGVGANGSTNILDVKGHPITVVGNTQISTAQSQFEGSSLLFDGTGDRLELASSTDWDLGTSDFTHRFWIRPRVSSATGFVCIRRNTSSPFAPFGILFNAGKIRVVLSTNGGASYTLDTTMATALTGGTWYFVSISRQDGVFYAHIGGTLDWSNSTIPTGSIYQLNEKLIIGEASAAGGTGLDAHLQDYEIIIGKSAYGKENYTPPTRSAARRSYS